MHMQSQTLFPGKCNQKAVADRPLSILMMQVARQSLRQTQAASLPAMAAAVNRLQEQAFQPNVQASSIQVRLPLSLTRNKRKDSPPGDCLCWRLLLAQPGIPSEMVIYVEH